MKIQKNLHIVKKYNIYWNHHQKKTKTKTKKYYYNIYGDIYKKQKNTYIKILFIYVYLDIIQQLSYKKKKTTKKHTHINTYNKNKKQKSTDI